MDQYKMVEVELANHYLFYSSQKINFEPNMEYKIYIDLTELPDITRSCTCFFETLTKIEDYSDQDNAKVPICNPFDFAANGHHLFGTLNQGGAPGPGIYNYIEFSEQSDYTYIDSADHIDGFINTLD
ncbi:MAG: hypothetical protein MJ201_03125 [Mycoplasmoidaceae bacterium]|nr:hypothetical protein [Mycoplasmoidaceae bacterium]